MEFRAVLFFSYSVHTQTVGEREKKPGVPKKISQTSTADKDQQNKFDMVVNFFFISLLMLYEHLFTAHRVAFLEFNYSVFKNKIFGVMTLRHPKPNRTIKPLQLLAAQIT